MYKVVYNKPTNKVYFEDVTEIKVTAEEKLLEKYIKDFISNNKNLFVNTHTNYTYEKLSTLFHRLNIKGLKEG